MTRPANILLGSDPIRPDPIFIGSGHDPVIKGRVKGFFRGPEPLNRSSIGVFSMENTESDVLGRDQERSESAQDDKKI